MSAFKVKGLALRVYSLGKEHATFTELPVYACIFTTEEDELAKQNQSVEFLFFYEYQTSIEKLFIHF
jgi:hypothetical protein